MCKYIICFVATVVMPPLVGKMVVMPPLVGKMVVMPPLVGKMDSF